VMERKAFFLAVSLLGPQRWVSIPISFSFAALIPGRWFLMCNQINQTKKYAKPNDILAGGSFLWTSALNVKLCISCMCIAIKRYLKFSLTHLTFLQFNYEP